MRECLLPVPTGIFLILNIHSSVVDGPLSKYAMALGSSPNGLLYLVQVRSLICGPGLEVLLLSLELLGMAEIAKAGDSLE